MDHVCIIAQDYLADLLAGRKTVESRLSTRRIAPFDKVRQGDRVYLKQRGGSFGAVAEVVHVEYFAGLTPKRIAGLRKIYEGEVRGGPGYWRAKRAARYGTFIQLGNVRAVQNGPEYRQRRAFSPRSAWHVLEGPGTPKAA
jgi:ASC-1-like (ASCH) protein